MCHLGNEIYKDGYVGYAPLGESNSKNISKYMEQEEKVIRIQKKIYTHSLEHVKFNLTEEIPLFKNYFQSVKNAINILKDDCDFYTPERIAELLFV